MRYLGGVLLVIALGVGTAVAVNAMAAGDPQPSPAIGPALSRDEERLLNYAEDILVGRCMSEHGFRYTARDPATLPDERDFRYVIDDPAWARLHGYGSDIQDSLDALAREPGNRDDSPAFQTALIGTQQEVLSVTLPTGQTLTADTRSCIATARGRLYGDHPTWFGVSAIATNLSPLVIPRVLADPAYQAAQTAWSTCLRERGITAATPDELRVAAGAATGGPAEARRVELADATAAADCAVASGFGRVARELDEKYTLEVGRDNRDAVRHHRSMQRAALPRAREITAAR
ncbi:hypothetical protein F4553_007086 [Allocatelliglobosispora scoriae]|uniref:Uncharacterized protein n=1 Tax=Allocatelliglobosispora scoriae TaxID=643052 RepID=A0A841C3L9_9ACTN|nr:hypothetical protein [Allocatelliglobosispora scoriae]MBB5873652.1 hypothetical protein [Allocatelliglobosispora scoriae]